MNKTTALSYWARPYLHRFSLGAAALLATNVLGYWVPRLLKRAIDSLNGTVDVRALGVIALRIFGVAVAQAAIRIASRLLIFNAGRDVEQRMRQRIFEHVLRWAPETLRRFRQGDLQSRLSNDLTNVRLLFGVAFLNVLNTAFAYSIALPLLFAESPRLALIALSPYPVMALAMVLMGRYIFRTNVQAQEKLSEVSNLVNEDLGARMFITASGLGQVEAQRFSVRNTAFLGANMKLVRSRAIMFPLMGTLASLGAALALLFGGLDVVAGRMTLGGLVAFIAYLGMLTFPTVMLGFVLALVQRGRASWQRISELLLTEPWASPETGHQPAEVSITLERLSLERGGKRVLNDVTLHIPQGQRVAIVGEIGSGKSTLLSVLSRLHEVPQGAYRIGGHDVTQLPLQMVRALVGLVPQQPFLFSMTVADNIAFGRDVASEEEERLAAETAAVLSDIQRLPQRLQTEIGERGVTLSGGQKQRIALARALLVKPKILLLDDSFSAVDAKTENAIIDALQTYPSTLIIATHRLAVVERLDRVIVMHEGRIIEDDTPAALIGRPSAFSALWQKQRLAEQLQQAAS